MKKISIIIPVYNEADTIEKIISKVENVVITPCPNVEKEIIIVNDGSTDDTKLKLEKYNHKIIELKNNHGKGFAVRKGVEHVTGEVVIIQDADLEYSPSDFSRLIEPFLECNADVVYGSRFVGSEMKRVLFFWHMIANKLITFICNMFTNLNLTDIETCYKAIKTQHLKKLILHENRFGIEVELTVKLAKLNLKFFEVGISYNGRTYEEGKKIGMKDAIDAIWCILKYSFNIFVF